MGETAQSQRDHLEPGPVSVAPTTGRGRQSRTHDRALASDSFLRPAFTLEQLRTFLAVASREHVTHAAKVLRLSQPAVTQQVQLLERALGMRLLERVGRRVRLTDAGVEVAGACLLVMRSLENVEAVAQALRGLDIGSVTVGASDLAVDYYLPPVITEFAATHPRVNVGVAVAGAEQVHHQVAAGYVDCGLVDGAPPPPELNLTHVQVATTDVVLVVNPGDVPADRLDPAGDFPPDLRYLAWGPGAATEALIAQVIGDAGDLLPTLQLGSMEAARRSVLHGRGFITAMPEVVVAADLQAGSLVAWCRYPESLPVFAVRRAGPDSPAVEALWRAVARPSASQRAGDTPASSANAGHHP